MKLTITKVSALVLAMCMCFTGCQKKPASIAQLETRPYITEQQVNQIENMTIYVYNEESSRLESRVVQVTVYPDQTKAEAVLNYLMSTEDFEFALNSYDIPDYTLSIAGSIAKVQIKNKYSRSSGKNLKGFAAYRYVTSLI